MNAVRVGVAGIVEPVPPALFAPLRKLHQLVDVLVIGLWRSVGKVRLQPLGSRWDPVQIETHAACPRPAIRRRSRLQPQRLQLAQDKAVDRIMNPAGVLDGWFGRFDGGDKRPVRLVGGSLGDPAFESVDLLRSDCLLARWGRHDDFRIGRNHPLDDCTFVRLAWNDG